jgi:hypothetical protein
MERTSEMKHGMGEDKTDGVSLDQILPCGEEMMTHKSGDPARGELSVHEFSSSPIESVVKEVLGAKNRG